jgi:hypothetical protein
MIANTPRIWHAVNFFLNVICFSLLLLSHLFELDHIIEMFISFFFVSCKLATKHEYILSSHCIS